MGEQDAAANDCREAVEGGARVKSAAFMAELGVGLKIMQRSPQLADVFRAHDHSVRLTVVPVADALSGINHIFHFLEFGGGDDHASLIHGQRLRSDEGSTVDVHGTPADFLAVDFQVSSKNKKANKSRQINRRDARSLDGFRRLVVLYCVHRF